MTFEAENYFPQCLNLFSVSPHPGPDLVTFAALLNRYLWHVYLNYLTL